MSSSKYETQNKDVAFNKEGEPQVAVDGFRQVLEMLRIADPAFRESLLKRLAARDRQLAADLRRDLNNL
jgi:hypothetical protein